ncbi:MAG: hypothetical protein HON05_08185 [Euryarchaeota archaeon]|jgi:hypothetical protein|nr:hypothetical protein [Euryarchaeota archaeon]MBT5026718.1 hypothetical protein [Euryarchaeota archaeon]MBT6527932.1 hypothetical protein [Euryarchaeota archaeon]
MSGIRKPKDDAEKIKARIAIAQGKGTSLEDFIENITGVKPEDEFVQAVKNRIELAHEQEETLDILALIKQMEELQNQWA